MGCWSALVELEPEADLAAFDDRADWLVELALEALWPWKDRAAATEIAPVSMTAAAITHRLIREISVSPASRALVVFCSTVSMIGPRR